MATNTKKKDTKGKRKTATTGRKGKEQEELTRGEGLRWTVGALLLFTAVVLTVSEASMLLSTPEHVRLAWLGELGDRVVRSLMQPTFGLATGFAAIFMFAAAVRAFGVGSVRLWKWFVHCALLMVWLSLGLAFAQRHFSVLPTQFMAGGCHGDYMLRYLEEVIGKGGTFLIILGFAVLYVLYVSGRTVATIRRAIAATRNGAGRLADMMHRKGSKDNEEEQEEKEEEPVPTASGTATTIEFVTEEDGGGEDTHNFKDLEMEIEVAGEQEAQHDAASGEKITIGTREEEADQSKSETSPEGPYDPKLDLENYRYPTIDLLDKHGDNGGVAAVDIDEQRENKKQILTLLSNFKVEITSIKATVGPTVTLYEITPAPGVRIAKIRNLEDDLALRLKAPGIRIIAPMPGKGTVGIEVPNSKPQMVSMESLINSRKFQESEYELPMALGKTITNEIFMVDLAKMPHLLVAGATGQGKSVGLNAIITSLLYKKHPAELKIVMVDPKKVEFSVYNPIVNHFLAQVEGTEDTDEPIITDVSKVIHTLKSLCQEMDTRYDLLKKSRARNVKEYNAKFQARLLNPENGHKYLPYIVVVIDEFGDLIMTAGKEIETPIARIAQMARAVGIHMIIATQRPSTNIITGPIRSNFPARMAFKVSSMIDSRIILDRPGADRLVGKGDMLFLAGMEPVRVQCAFVDTPEVERICNHIACQQSYPGPFPLPFVESDEQDAGGKDVDMDTLDPMFDEVARLVVSTQQGSTSMIQRKFSIGYNRAGRLMDQLEKAGIVGQAHGSKPREVLCMSMDELEYKLNNLR